MEITITASAIIIAGPMKIFIMADLFATITLDVNSSVTVVTTAAVVVVCSIVLATVIKLSVSTAKASMGVVTHRGIDTIVESVGDVARIVAEIPSVVIVGVGGAQVDVIRISEDPDVSFEEEAPPSHPSA